jgi:hypothetical protein
MGTDSQFSVAKLLGRIDAKTEAIAIDVFDIKQALLADRKDIDSLKNWRSYMLGFGAAVTILLGFIARYLVTHMA